MHGPYAIFQKYSRKHNNGRNIGLIRASETRMGGYAIAFQRLSRLQEPLQETLESPDFIKLKVTINVLVIIIQNHILLLYSNNFLNLFTD